MSSSIGRRVIVLGGGNTAMDCCRTARRLGGEEVRVVVRSGFEEMKASPWEKEDAMHEGIPILNYLVPKAFTHEGGRLTGVLFEKVEPPLRRKGRRELVPTGEPDVHIPCDDVLVAIGQENAFPWIERDVGLEFDRRGMPVVDPVDHAARPTRSVFFGGDAAFGPKNIIWAVAHGHEAAVSIDRLCRGRGPSRRARRRTCTSPARRWASTSGATTTRSRSTTATASPRSANELALHNLKVEVELGYDRELAWREAQRCLNCDIQTVFAGRLCIECDACVDICPIDCITFTWNGPEDDLRARLSAPRPPTSPRTSIVSVPLKTGRVMVKDEDVCLHCGLCAERCPTGAWDMQKFLLDTAQAGQACRSR